MWHPRIVFLLALSFAAAAGGAAMQPQPRRESPATQPAMRVVLHVDWDRYAVVADRNIFVRGRQRGRASTHHPPRQTPRTPTTQPATTERARWVLTGVVILGSRRVAFFENSITGRTVRATPGQTLAFGRVVSVAVNSVRIDAGGTLHRCAIGAAVDGGPLPTMAAAPGGDGATGDPAATQPAQSSPGTAAGDGATDAATAKLLQRLRAKRKAQLAR